MMLRSGGPFEVGCMLAAQGHTTASDSHIYRQPFHVYCFPVRVVHHDTIFLFLSLFVIAVRVYLLARFG